jgi:hypothetical protein
MAWQDCFCPKLDEVANFLNRWFVPMFPQSDRLFLAYDKDNIEALQEDRNALWKRMGQGVKDGLVTQNEGRESLGYEKYKGEGAEEADVLRVAVQTAPINESSTFEQPDPAEAENMQADQQRAKAFELINHASWLTDEQKCALTGFEYLGGQKAIEAPPAPPVINVDVAPPSVSVNQPPINISLTLPSGKKTQVIHRDENGLITSTETTDAVE